MGNIRKFEFVTEDETKLVGHLYVCEKPKALVVVNPATAILTTYYKYFVEFLTSNNFNVFLWNYRGFGESKFRTLKKSQYKFSDIGFYDIPAAFNQAKKIANDLPIFCIGHSVGGQHVGFVKNRAMLNGLIVVASSAGYYLNMSFPYLLKALFFFKIFAPVTGRIFKYIPAKKFNFMEDLPAPFVYQWGTWCDEKNLYFSDKHYGTTVPEGTFKDLEFPVHVIVSDDDEICTPKNMTNFWLYPTSKKGITFEVYNATDYPKKKIGHFGYFKEHNKKIWTDIILVLHRWLDSMEKI